MRSGTRRNGDWIATHEIVIGLLDAWQHADDQVCPTQAGPPSSWRKLDVFILARVHVDEAEAELMVMSDVDPNVVSGIDGLGLLAVINLEGLVNGKPCHFTPTLQLIANIPWQFIRVQHQ